MGMYVIPCGKTLDIEMPVIVLGKTSGNPTLQSDESKPTANNVRVRLPKTTYQVDTTHFLITV